MPTLWRDCSHLLTLVPSSRISYILKMEAISSSEMSVNTTSTRRHIPEDCFLHNYNWVTFFRPCFAREATDIEVALSSFRISSGVC
jgi:hypothetical protein